MTTSPTLVEATPQAVTIRGHRWFQRSCGNTYHTVTVMYGDCCYSSEKTYGYGDCYIQTAIELLHGHGHLLEVRSPGDLTRYCRENALQCSVSVLDVKRERDL